VADSFLHQRPDRPGRVDRHRKLALESRSEHAATADLPGTVMASGALLALLYPLVDPALLRRRSGVGGLFVTVLFFAGTDYTLVPCLPDRW
jgi:hypothetical protein